MQFSLQLAFAAAATAFWMLTVTAAPLNGNPVAEQQMREKLAYTGLNSHEKMTVSKRYSQTSSGSTRDECIRNCEENKNGKVYFCITNYCH